MTPLVWRTNIGAAYVGGVYYSADLRDGNVSLFEHVDGWMLLACVDAPIRIGSAHYPHRLPTRPTDEECIVWLARVRVASEMLAEITTEREMRAINGGAL